MIERLSMDDEYSPQENAIHLNRYELSKQFCKNKKILDLACGEGYGSFLLKKWGAKEVTGVDISEYAIKKAKSNFKSDNLNYMVGDATALFDLKDNYFDMIVSFETFEHVNNVELYLKEIKRVSKENAIIIISCPNDYYYYPEDNDSNPYHTKKFTFEEFRTISEHILGTNVQYMLGLESNGYINVSINEIKKNKSNIEIIEEKRNIISTVINTNYDIEHKNCNYYVGIWNVEKLEENSVIFPCMYTNWKQNIDNQLESVKNQKTEKKELEILLSEQKEENERLVRDNHKLREANKILYEQIEAVRKFSYENYCDYMIINSQLNQIYNSRSYRWTQRIINMIKKVKRK